MTLQPGGACFVEAIEGQHGYDGSADERHAHLGEETAPTVDARSLAGRPLDSAVEDNCESRNLLEHLSVPPDAIPHLWSRPAVCPYASSNRLSGPPRIAPGPWR